MFIKDDTKITSRINRWEYDIVRKMNGRIFELRENAQVPDGYNRADTDAVDR